ncbi:MAG: PSD1 and planctomycete cytochrome C domain-containing protein [Planctomycetota bacterium]
MKSASLVVLLTFWPAASLWAAEGRSEKTDFFESKIRPLLIDHCYDCHSEAADLSEGELLVDSASGLLRGGSLGPALVPGKADASLIVRAVRYDDASLQMPPSEKLDAESIALLERWVKEGAVDPRQGKAHEEAEGPIDSFDPQSHWAFRMPKRQVASGTSHESDRDVIDSLARDIARKAGVSVAERCGDEVLVRRLYHDLVGLPPTLEQVRAFAESTEPDKTEQLVDHLLASPAYAERFARHWMDVARYADTVGYAFAGQERRIIGSERYRDWLIRAFAEDVPYDEMIRLQLAADRYDPENERGHLDAMGFLTIGRRYINQFDTIDDRIDVVTRGLLGMTVSCARCHDHKFDPIPTKDYYALVGVFQSSKAKPDGASPLMLVDKAKPFDSHVFLRGQQGARGDVAPRQFLTALRKPDEPRFSDGSGRKELAERIATRENPLVARVFVNRIWKHLIGRPMVDTASDFGVRTNEPALATVLDELAAEFAEHWSVKRLVKRIATSRIYAQAVAPADEADPENRLATRGNRKRKNFEALRDSMLDVCEMLDRTVGGTSVEVHLAAPVPRRTVYAKIDRQNLPSLFRTFDLASPDAHTPNRAQTTVPQQALFLMNHPQMGKLTTRLANQIRSRSRDPDAFVETAFQRVLSREPDEQERQMARAFLASQARQTPDTFDPRKAWRYGTATVNEECRVDDFEPFPHFSGANWQADKKFPAGNEFGYAFLGVKDGHPGGGHAVVRRLIAPADGQVSLAGVVAHRSREGDGIELAIWIGGKRVWKETQKSNNRPFSGIKGFVRAGETIDLVASPKANASHDTFFLQCTVNIESETQRFETDSQADFSGPLDPEFGTLDRSTQLIQTLLLSNEFLFVD